MNASVERMSTWTRIALACISFVGVGVVPIDAAYAQAKGTAGKGNPNNPPPPTYPAARAWHAFTTNSGSDEATSRLYMYGGSGAGATLVPADLWYYSAFGDSWTLVTPTGTTKPGRLQHNGLSCGGGACLLATGNNGGQNTNETWVYSEATNAWTQVACRRSITCPSPRRMTTVAYDVARGNHVMFGGVGEFPSGHDDTLTFDVATLKWSVKSPSFKPSERNRAAATSVPGIGVVMHGGMDRLYQSPKCDLFAWNGSTWNRITYDTTQPYPCLFAHSAAWDGQSLVVTGGYDTSYMPNPINWRFAFAADGRSGVWSKMGNGTCQPVAGSTDPVIHPGGKMSYDAPTRTRVYFGGELNVDGAAVRYDNTIECH